MKRSALNKILVWMLLLVVVCGGLLAAATFFFNGSYLAGRITAALANAGHSIAFRETPVSSLFPPKIDFGQITGKARIGSLLVDFTVESGTVEPNLTGFLFGRIDLAKLTLNRPVLEVTPASPTQGTGAGFPEIGHLLVQDGQIDFASPSGSLRLAGFKLVGRNIRPRKEMDLKCDCVLNWVPASGPFVAGNLAIQTKLRYYAPNLTFREGALSFTATDNGFLSQYSPLQIHFEGGLDLQELRPRVRSFDLSLPGLQLAGKGDFQKDKFAGEISLTTELSLFAPLKGQIGINSQFELDEAALSLKDMALKIGSCSGSGTARMLFERSGSPMSIAADLHTGTFSLDEFALVKDEKQSAQSVPCAWPSLDLRLAMEGLRKDKLELTDLSVSVKGNDGAYRIENSAANWAQGKITAAALLDFPALRFSLNSQGKKLSLGKALAQLGIDGFAAGPTDYSLQLSSTGTSVSEVLNHISGSGQLQCERLRVQLPAGVAFFMGKLGKNLPDALNRVRINFRGEDGNLSFSPVTASGPGFQATGSAQLNVASEQLNGTFILKALALEFPVSFEGPWGNLSWSFGR